MKLHHLRDVVAIAERGSLRAAARHLQLAQPALSRSLGELERELGVPLFERQSRGMALTATGHAFVRRATAILHDVRRAREEVDQLGGGTGGSVAAGLSIAPHIALLPAALRPFRQRYPGVQLRIIEGFYPTLAGGLADGSIDFYIGPEPGGPILPDLQQERLFSNTRIILGRRNHPLAAPPAWPSCPAPSGRPPPSRPRRRGNSVKCSSATDCHRRGWPCRASPP